MCSQLLGLHTAKLAVILTIIGGVSRRNIGGLHIRAEPHLLLVGDPGMFICHCDWIFFLIFILVSF